MKHVKKLLAMVLALVMIMSLAVSAFAADTTITISTSASGASVEGHKYEIYQIFTGDVAVVGEGAAAKDILSNVAFGEDYQPTEFTTVEAAMNNLKTMSGADAAAYLEGKLTDKTPFRTLPTAEGSYSASVPTGYYLIIDVTEELPEGDSRSAYILEVTDSVTVKSKHDTVPETYKKIDDINDSTREGVAIEWHDSADHDIGDLIDFQLNAVIPGSFGAFKDNNVAYPFTFHDVECPGLDYQGVKVEKVEDAQIKQVYFLDKDGVKHYIADTQYTVVENVPHEGAETCTFEVRFTDLTQINDLTSGCTLVFEYQSRLNEDAVIGSAGNPNKMRGEFKRYDRPDSPEFTPWDTVIAFTYKVNVDKYANEVKAGNELKGAEFTLYKEVPESYTDAESGADIKEGLAENVKATDLENEKYYVVAQQVETDAAGDSFAFKGVDDGIYVLVETKIPAGYNAWDDVKFEIKATHEETADAPKLLTLTGGELFTGEVEAVRNSGILDADVINNSGVELPETGDIGTTLFYVLGSAMVIVAVVFLVTKKRMSNME